jgi:hypothetical protein
MTDDSNPHQGTSRPTVGGPPRNVPGVTARTLMRLTAPPRRATRSAPGPAPPSPTAIPPSTRAPGRWWTMALCGVALLALVALVLALTGRHAAKVDTTPVAAAPSKSSASVPRAATSPVLPATFKLHALRPGGGHGTIALAAVEDRVRLTANVWESHRFALAIYGAAPSGAGILLGIPFRANSASR